MASEINPISSKQENFNAVFDLTAIASVVIALPSVIIWGITKKKAFLYVAIGIIGFLVLSLIYESIFLRDKSNDSSGFAGNPKVGDTFVKDGIKYTFTCAKTPTVTANHSCNGNWKTDNQIKGENMIEGQSFAAGGKVSQLSSQKIGQWEFKNINCENHIIVNGRKYNLSNVGDSQSFPGNKSSTGYFATYIDSQTHLESSGINYSISKQDFDEHNMRVCNPMPPGPMASCDKNLVDYCMQLIANSQARLSKGGLSAEASKNIQRGIDQIQKWLDDCKNSNIFHNKWGFYISRENRTNHTTILYGGGPPPAEFKKGQKIKVDIFPNVHWQGPSKSYSATILGFDNKMGVITDIPYTGLTNLPPNIIPTMGDGYVSY